MSKHVYLTLPKTIFTECIFSHFKFCYDVKPLTSEKFVGPYAPYWDSSLQRILLVDFFDGNLINIDYKTKQTVKATIDGISKTTFIIPVKGDNNHFVVSNKLSASVIEWSGKEPVAKVSRNLFTVERGSEYAETNWNIALASPKCTFFGGTYRGSVCGNTKEPDAEFFIYGKESGIEKIDLPGLKASSGIVWNKEGTKFYHTAGCGRAIREFDYDSATGKICK